MSTGFGIRRIYVGLVRRYGSSIPRPPFPLGQGEDFCIKSDFWYDIFKKHRFCEFEASLSEENRYEKDIRVKCVGRFFVSGVR